MMARQAAPSRSSYWPLFSAHRNAAEAIRRGAQFVTTQTDLAFLAAAAGNWAQGVRTALGQRLA